MTGEKFLVLVEAEGRRQVPAPEGYDWQKYPEIVVIDDHLYLYAGTTDGTPHYRG